MTNSMSTQTVPASGQASIRDGHLIIGQPTDATEQQQPTVSSTVNSTLSFKKVDFLERTQRFTLATNGDTLEKQFVAAGLLLDFPTYEAVWRALVIPATNRMTIDTELSLREGLADRILSMCQFHYSIMRSLSLAYAKTESKEEGAIEEFIMHLENAFEQAELFLIFWIMNCVHPRPKRIRKLNIGDLHLRRRANRKEILDSYFYNTREWGAFKGQHNLIQTVRDSYLHGPVPITLVSSRQGKLTPTFDAIRKRPSTSNPQFWRNLYNGKESISTDDFGEYSVVTSGALINSLKIIERLWAKQLPEVETLFFKPGNLSSYRLQIN